MSSKERKLTIIIPTKNRHGRLKQSLQYYIQKRFLGHIIVADASTGRSANAVEAVVQRAQQDGLNIRLLKCKEQRHYGEAIKAASALVGTPYVMYCRDDDIAVKKAVIACIEFLDMNSSYTAAGGTRSTRIKCGTHNGIQHVRCLEIETDYVANRLALYLRTRICTTHYVHRIDVWRKMFKYADSMPNKWLGGEVLPCCISVMSGRIKDVLADSLYGLMFRSYGPDSHVQNLHFLDVLHSENYLKSAKILRRVLLRYLTQGGLDQKTAERFYDKEMWLSTLILFLNKFVERYPHLKPIIDEYNKSLEVYPFEWRFPALQSSLVTDPLLPSILKGELLDEKRCSVRQKRNSQSHRKAIKTRRSH